MSADNALSPAGEPARLVVPARTPMGPPGGLVPMALRLLVCLGALALASFGLGPARALEGAKPAISGLNPGPFKPAQPKPSVAIKPVETRIVDTRIIETTGAIDPKAEGAKPAEPSRPIESAQVAEVKAPEAAPEPVRPAPKPPAYCASIADAAADARFAWQKEQLATLEKQVEERIAALEAKRAEYETWLARRDAFLAKADEGVVAIYTKMRADAAALQLANMPDESAAAILTKLNARTASAILSEMEAARAAQLARMMTEMGKKARESEKS
jgi:flagellar motility protein MotE (MotC chaperone)